MPNTYEATDPKTGQKWTWDGKKWNAVQPASGVDKFGMDVATGMGFDAGKIRSAYQTGGFTGQLKEIGGESVSGLKDFATRVAMDPLHIVDPLHGMASSLTKALGLPDKSGEGFHAPVPGQVIGAGANILGGAEGAERVPKPSISGKAVVRDLLGVGEKDVESFTKKVATKEDAAHAKALAKVEKAKESYAGAVSDALKKRAEASAKETAAKTKQEALASKHGPVYKRMNEMADTAQQNIAKVEKTVHDAEQSKWGEFEKELGDPPTSTEGLRESIVKAESSLTGETLPVFKKIMNEIGEEDSSVKQLLEGMNPEVRKRAMEAGVAPNQDVPFSTMRKIYTKLSRAAGAAEAAPEVRRAASIVLDAADDSIAQRIVSKGGAEALSKYRQLQKRWREYRQTFSDRDSPLRKVREAKDPSTKLGPITGETGARAIEYLGRYRDMGAQPEQLGKIRALYKALKELPGSGGKAPGMPERPTLPEVPAKKTVTPQSARETMLEGKGQFYSRPPSKWELMFPPLLAYKQTLKHLMQSKDFRNWLSKDNPSTPVP